MSRLRDICGEFFATLRRADFGLFAATSALSLLSILTLAGGYSVFGLKVILMQTGATLVGIAMMFLISVLDYRTIAEKLGIYLYAAGLVCLSQHCCSVRARARIKAGFLSPACLRDQALRVCQGNIPAHLFISYLPCEKKINKPLTLAGLLIHAGCRS